MDLQQIGAYAFLVGIGLAIIGGIAPGMIGAEITVLLLVALGLVVGVLNVTDKETTPFLVAAIALLASGAAGLGALPGIGAPLGSVLTYLSAFVAPAALIVSLKAIYSMASSK